MLSKQQRIKYDFEQLSKSPVPYGTGWNDIPVIPNIHQAVYNWVCSNPDNFNMDFWRVEAECGTAYCRAGIVVMLAGDPFPELWEYWHVHAVGIPNLARLIYFKSDPSLDWEQSGINFFGSDEDEEENIAKLAQQEASLAQGK